MARALGLLTLFLVLHALTPATAKGQAPVGYVLEIRGAWYLNGNPANVLRRWQKLPASSVIRVQSPNRFDMITIADMRGGIFARLYCPESCADPLRLPPNPERPSLRGRFLQAAMEWLWGSPDRYVAARGRSGEMSEGVTKLVDGSIDLNPLLHLQGEYYLRWRLLVPNQKAELAPWSETIELNRTVTSSEFKPGLYEFNVLRRIEKKFEATSSAWVLVTSPAHYEKTKKSHEEAVSLTKAWEGKVEPETIPAFLRANLEELAHGRVR